MFTGIIDHCGTVLKIEKSPDTIQLSITHQFSDLTLGESICVDGICLTVTHFDENTFSCDLSSETLEKTCAKEYHEDSVVNLERAMRLSERLGGHIVTGHIDTTLKAHDLKKQNEFLYCEFSVPDPEQVLLLTEKGSVCINGVSLTINAVMQNVFSIMLIPHTLDRTNLHKLKIGDTVNVEYDYLAKLVHNNVKIQMERT